MLLTLLGLLGIFITSLTKVGYVRCLSLFRFVRAICIHLCLSTFSFVLVLVEGFYMR